MKHHYIQMHLINKRHDNSIGYYIACANGDVFPILRHRMALIGQQITRIYRHRPEFAYISTSTWSHCFVHEHSYIEANSGSLCLSLLYIYLSLCQCSVQEQNFLLDFGHRTFQMKNVSEIHAEVDTSYPFSPTSHQSIGSSTKSTEVQNSNINKLATLIIFQAVSYYT